MTPLKASERIEAIIREANNRLSKALYGSQSDIYNSILSELKNLEVDSSGYILQNGANRKTIREVNKLFDRALWNSGYTNELSVYLKTITSIDAINAEYFNTIKEGFNTSFVQSLQRQTITEVESLLLNDGLESQIKQPLINILYQNVNTGGSYSGLVDQIKLYVRGNEDREGKLLRYVKQITQDALNNYSRAYQTAVGESLGLVFYAYVGGIMAESREFCQDRINGYYHYLEVESWAKLEWKGKRADTTESSIFIYAGGHNCEHQMLPVSTFAVPKEWLKRAEDLGFYQVSPK